MRTGYALLAIALLGGCASSQPPRRVDLAAQCAISITALQAHPLALPVAEAGKPPPFTDFADVGECLQTDTGKVATALFGLPDMARPAQVTLTIQANAAATLATAVTLLDADRQPLQRHGFDAFVRRGHTFTLDMFLNDADHKIAYLLLTPDAAWVGKADESTRGGTSTMVIPVGLAFVAFNTGYEARSRRELTDAGSIRIEIKQASR
jgi:hypothetical protein